MTNLMLRSALAMLFVMMGGCSTIESLNPFSSSATKTKPAELVAIVPTAEFRVAWQSSIGESKEYSFTPAVIGNSLYAAARDGSVARYDDGRQVWRINAGQTLSGGVGSDGKLVVVGTSKGEVLAFDAAKGSSAWKARVNSEVLAAPAVSDSLVVIRSGDSRIFGFEAADGKRRWVYQRATPTLSLRSFAGVVVAGRTILSGFPGGKLVALSAENGAVLWEATVALPKGATELERISDITSVPVSRGNEVCAVAYQGRVTCFDLGNGSQLWSREVSSSSGLDMDAKSVYVSDEKGSVLAFDRSNGSSLWKQDKLFMRGLSRPLVVGKHLVVGDADGVAHLMNCEDGSFAARFGGDGGGIFADPQRFKDGLVIQTRSGGIFALSVH
jgi:outer membrane protein assembly factor BamB